jgi:hypothetical protein
LPSKFVTFVNIYCIGDACVSPLFGDKVASQRFVLNKETRFSVEFEA